MNDKLISFLYFLMRDKLPVGEVENLIHKTEHVDPRQALPYLENYARQLAERLRY